MHLTAKTVATMALGGDVVRDKMFWDDILKGFGLRLREGKDGKPLRSWVVQYRDAHGREHRIKLGNVDVMNAAQARAAAMLILGQNAFDRAYNIARHNHRIAVRNRRAAEQAHRDEHRQYGKQVRMWKAAYDALREMGVPIEEEVR